MRKPISLLTVPILVLFASLIVGVLVAKAQYAPGEQMSATISPSSATTIDYGQSVQFTASANGGAPPYSYQWYSNDNPVPDATSSSFRFTPNHSGIYSISVTVTDNATAQASSNGTLVTVNTWLNLKIEAGSSTTNVNQPVQFSAFVTGGTPPYQYQWYYQLSPHGEPVAGSTYQSFTFTPTSSGTYVIGLVVTDSANAQTGNVALPITVTVLGTTTPSPSPTPTITPAATPTPTPTPSAPPTPQPVLGTPLAHPMIAAIVVIIAAIIAALAMLEKQKYRSLEKPKA